MADAYLTCEDWDVAQKKVLAGNLLQARSPASARRMERELRQRLIHLTPAQIRLAAHGMTDERTAIGWLAAMKGSRFIYAFASDILRAKLALLDPVVRASDYEAFILNQIAAHPDLASLTASSRAKIRSVLFSMVREAGMGLPGRSELRVQRPLVPPAVLNAIRSDSKLWLAGFLVPDSELATY